MIKLFRRINPIFVVGFPKTINREQVDLFHERLVKELKGLNKLFEKCDNSKTSHSFNGVASGINNEIYETTFLKKTPTSPTRRKSLTISYRKSKTKKNV